MRRTLGVTLAVALGLGACGAPTGSTTAPTTGAGTPGPTASSDAAPSASSGPERPRIDLKYATPSQIGFAEIPELLAFERLAAEQNIHVEGLEFESGDLGIRALVAGQVDMAVVFPSGMMTAAREGNVRLILNAKNNEWVLATRSDIATPSDLDGKKIARHSPNDLTAALLGDTVERYGVSPELITIPGSENRVAALLSGNIDGSPVDLAGLDVLETQAPGKFKALIRYADELPGLIVTNHTVANADSLARDPETWAIVVQYKIETFRRANEEPEWLAAEAQRFLPDEDPEALKRMALAYQEYGAFTRDGSLKRDKMEELIQFYVDAGALKAEDVVPFDRYATTEFVDKALEVLGP